MYRINLTVRPVKSNIHMYLLIQVRVVFHSSVVPTIPHVDYGDLLLTTKIKQRKHYDYYNSNRENITDFHDLIMVLNTSPIPNRYILVNFFFFKF